MARGWCKSGAVQKEALTLPLAAWRTEAGLAAAHVVLLAALLERVAVLADELEEGDDAEELVRVLG